MSRYAYSADYNSVYTGFSTLRQKGINRVYFNIWADGNLYANSATAQANGEAGDDTLDNKKSIALITIFIDTVFLTNY